MSGVASYRYTLDGVPGTGRSVSAGQGEHTLAFSASDAAGNWAATSTASFAVNGGGAATVQVVEIEGGDRIGTAVAASNEAFADGAADTVIVCTAYNFPDALGASALAGAYDAPLLLTAPGSLPGAVSDEIQRLGAANVVVIGSEAAVSTNVETALRRVPGVVTVSRVGGSDRYETSAMVAAETIAVMESNGRTYDGTCFVATGLNFPDALAAAPLSASRGWPILLTKTDALPSFASDAMTDMGVSKAIIVGSARTVSGGVATTLAGRLGSGNVTRESGDTRYQTSIAIAQLGIENGLSLNGVALATGQNFPDALAGGPMQGKLGGVVLLTPSKSLDTDVRTLLSQNKATVKLVRYLGSEAALARAVRDSVTQALR